MENSSPSIIYKYITMPLVDYLTALSASIPYSVVLTNEYEYEATVEC
jgi:hypothetical protein